MKLQFFAQAEGAFTMKFQISQCTTVGEIRELLLKQTPLLHTRHAEVIQHLCDIGLNPDQARETWLFIAQKELPFMEESSSTQLTLDIFSDSLEILNGK